MALRGRGFRAPQWFIEQEAEKQRKQQELAERPVREAEAALAETHRKLYKLGKDAVVSGTLDPGFEIPETARRLSMTQAQALEYARQQADVFVKQNPEYWPSQKNLDAILNYILTQGVRIPTVEVFRQAWLRLRSFGLIEDRPETPPEDVQEIQQPRQPPNQEEATRDKWREYKSKVVAIDRRNGNELTEQMLDEMTADEYRAAIFGQATPMVKHVFRR